MKFTLTSLVCLALYWASNTAASPFLEPEPLSENVIGEISLKKLLTNFQCIKIRFLLSHFTLDPEQNSLIFDDIRYTEEQLRLLNGTADEKAGLTNLAMRWPKAEVWVKFDSSIRKSELLTFLLNSLHLHVKFCHL